MSSAIEFLNETFTDLEIKSFIDENEDCWFQLSHVCKVLGYSNTTDAMNYHTDKDERQLLEPVPGFKVWFISEEGLYGLILGSKKPEAKSFKKWVKTVLKKLRSQGYLIIKKDSETLAALESEVLQLRESNKLLEASTEQAQLEARRSSELTQKFVNYLSDLNRFALEMRLGVGFYKVENLNLNENMHHIFNIIQMALSFINKHKQIIDDIDIFTCSYDTTQNSDYASEYVYELLMHIEKRNESRI